jgi:hypothetical protein
MASSSDTNIIVARATRTARSSYTVVLTGRLLSYHITHLHTVARIKLFENEIMLAATKPKF